MKNPILILSLVILLCAAFGCQKQAEEVAGEAKPTFNVEADKEAVEVLVEHFFASHESGDLDGLMITFTDDAIFMPDDSGVIDKNAARDRFAPSFENYNLDADPTIDEIEVSGNLGFARCSYLMKLTPKAEGDEMQISGKFIFILKRQPDNAWRSTHFIWNSNTPPPEIE